MNRQVLGVAITLAIWSASIATALASFMLKEGLKIETRSALLPWTAYAAMMAVTCFLSTRNRPAFTGAGQGAIIGLIVSLSLLLAMAFTMIGIEPDPAIWILVTPSVIAGAASGWASSAVATSLR